MATPSGRYAAYDALGLRHDVHCSVAAAQRVEDDSGQTRSVTELHIDTVEFLDGRD
jgi:hypothetical protein